MRCARPSSAPATTGARWMNQLLNGHANTCLTRKRAACLTASTSSFQPNGADRDAPAHSPDPGAPGRGDKALDGLQHSTLRLLVQQLISEAKAVQIVRSAQRARGQLSSRRPARRLRTSAGQLLNDVLEQASAHRLAAPGRCAAKARRCPRWAWP